MTYQVTVTTRVEARNEERAVRVVMGQLAGTELTDVTLHYPVTACGDPDMSERRVILQPGSSHLCRCGISFECPK